MNTLRAIAARRSIRKFKDTPIPRKTVNTIITAATQAPSGKNSQPWRFLIVDTTKREALIEKIRSGISKAKEQGRDTGSSTWTLKVMAQAPLTIFILAPNGLHPWEDRSMYQTFMDVVDIQSIGASIQNMLLAAWDLGIGSLWICDVFYAYEDILEWLGEDSQMIAAVSFGYPDESPGARPRKPVEEVARWV